MENQEYSAYDRVTIARDANRPKITDFIDFLFEDFIELRGDRCSGEDAGILGGIAMFHNIPVTVIGNRKGKTVEENLICNFGMSEAEGYRKATRLMEQAEKFKRPIITFVDTPGAYPGMKAEERGISLAIGTSIAKMSRLKVPVITVITGEGNSGGALGIAVANYVMMLENAVYSILSPEGFASILWKNSKDSREACEIMKLQANDLLEYGLIDEVIKEPEGGIKVDSLDVFECLDRTIYEKLMKYKKVSGEAIAKQRYQKFRKLDENYI